MRGRDSTISPMTIQSRIVFRFATPSRFTSMGFPQLLVATGWPVRARIENCSKQACYRDGIASRGGVGVFGIGNRLAVREPDHAAGRSVLFASFQLTFPPRCNVMDSDATERLVRSSINSYVADV